MSQGFSDARGYSHRRQPAFAARSPYALPAVPLVIRRSGDRCVGEVGELAAHGVVQAARGAPQDDAPRGAGRGRGAGGVGGEPRTRGGGGGAPARHARDGGGAGERGPHQGGGDPRAGRGAGGGGRGLRRGGGGGAGAG